MPHEVLINAGIGETRVAVVEDGRLVDLVIERRSDDGGDAKCDGLEPSLVGSVMLGRVQRVLPSMQAAFVDIGLEKAGFLAVREAKRLGGLAHEEDLGLPCISKLVREGESLLVQVIKDPIGEKGARLTANVTLPGRLLVLLPYQSGVTLSRRITDEIDRERLTAAMQSVLSREGLPPAGVIMRTAALRAPPEELAADVDALMELWKAIQARGRMANKPGILHRDLDAVQRCLRDTVDEETARVLIDCPLALGGARAYVERVMPHAAAKVSAYRGPQPIFDLYDVEDQIERLLHPRVTLPSGGWMTIESTEALTAVDINSGSFTGGNCLEATSVRTNLDAAIELGRQLRLRGIGGVIVVDFIHMSEQENVQSVLDALANSLAQDRVPTQMSGMSEFGLVEITRKRVREPLAKLLTEQCCTCHGSARMRSIATIANEIVRRVSREARANPGRKLAAYAAPEIVEWVDALGEETRRVVKLRLGADVTWRARSDFPRERFDVGLDIAK
jgi:ribonuclease G